MLEEPHPRELFVLRLPPGLPEAVREQPAQEGWVAGGGEGSGAAGSAGDGGGTGTGRDWATVPPVEENSCEIDETSLLPSSISLSIVFLSSSEARLNSARPFPSDFPISGSFLGPKTRSATTKIRMSSGIPMEPNMF